MVNTLCELRDILNKRGYPGQARVVDRLIHLHDRDRDEFRRLLQSVEMWGGAGAVWEVGYLFTDAKRFGELIIRLAGEMDAAGLRTARSQDIADTFRSWHAQDLS